MRHNSISFLFSSLLLLALASCGPKSTPTPPQTWEMGITLTPQTVNADEPLTITFKAGVTSPLFNYTGSVYAHIGAVEGETWYYVPAAWDQNISKCEMKKIADNTWQLELKPSVREWFDSGSMPLTKIGLVIRSADGTKKDSSTDHYYPVTDNKVVLPEAKTAPLATQYQEGINISADRTSVTLVLNDTDKNGTSKYRNAYVIGSFTNWERSEKYAMNRDTSRGLWWITLTGLDASNEYGFQYYLFDDQKQGLRIAEPYAEKVLAPEDKDIPGITSSYPYGKTNGYVSTFILNKPAYSWKATSFTAPDPDDLIIYEMHLRDYTASHNLSGALAKLDALKALGVNAIELMPIQEFSGNDSWGYNPIFYFAMDKSYGTIAEYKAFIDACHQRGMAVILDVVYNHMDMESPFFKLYSQYGKPTANNPYFNISAPHPYSVFFDLNHESTRTREMVKRNLQYLLEEYKVDGFRFDLSKGLTNTSSNESTAGNYDAKRIAILKEYNSAIKAVSPKAYTILEHFAEAKEEKELAQAGMLLWRNLNNAYCQSGMGWQQDSGFEYLHTDLQGMPYGSLVGYMESHDEERVSYKQKTWGVDDVKNSLATRMDRLQLNAAFFLTVPGPKMIWQYGEYGYDISINENGRTGRKPIWSTELTNTDRKELADMYSKILAIRKQNPELFNTGIPFNWSVNASIWSSVRTITLGSGSKQLVIVGNFQPTASATYQLQATMKNALTGTTVNAGTLNIPANSFLILITQ